MNLSQWRGHDTYVFADDVLALARVGRVVGEVADGLPARGAADGDEQLDEAGAVVERLVQHVRLLVRELRQVQYRPAAK